MAKGSLSEVETQMVVAKELGYVNEIEEFEKKVSELYKMLHVFHQKLSK